MFVHRANPGPATNKNTARDGRLETLRSAEAATDKSCLMQDVAALAEPATLGVEPVGRLMAGQRFS